MLTAGRTPISINRFAQRARREAVPPRGYCWRVQRRSIAIVSVVVVIALLAATLVWILQRSTSTSTDQQPTPAQTQWATPTDTAAQYWGLPRSISNNPDSIPAGVGATTFAGYVKSNGDAQYLSGLHPKGVRVKRGGHPEVSNIEVSDDGIVTATVTASSALTGKAIPPGAKELVAVNVVLTSKESNPSRRVPLFQDLQWFELTGKQLVQPVTVTMSSDAQQQMADWSSADVGDALVIHAVQVIDVDGIVINGRYTADHLKNTATSYAASQAAKQGVSQGVELTVMNDDADPTNLGYAMINLTTQPVSCMQTSGSSDSDTSAFNITGMSPQATTEGLMASTTDGQPANQAPAATDVVTAMTEDYTEAAIEVLAGATLSWTTAAFDIFEELGKLALSGCGGQNAPGFFTVAATDQVGNASQIGYTLGTLFNDGSSAYSNGGPGGLADVNSAYNIYDPAAGDNAGPNEVANYIAHDYLENNFGPGPAGTSFTQAPPVGVETTPITGSGGDNGLSFQALTANGIPQLGTEDKFPQIQLSATWGNACSSLLGGAWETTSETSDGLTTGFVQNPCAGWPSAPTPQPLPSTQNLTLPVLSPTTVTPGTVLTTTAGTWSPTDVTYQVQWYSDREVAPDSGGWSYTVPADTGAGTQIFAAVCATANALTTCSSSNHVTVTAPTS